MPKPTDRWDLDRLARESGVSPRTIRNWISLGLVPGPHSKGRYAEYSQRHLDRIRDIQRLREQADGISFAEIRRALSGLGASPLPVAESKSSGSALSYLQSITHKSADSPETGAKPAPEPRSEKPPASARQAATLDRLLRELRRLVLHRSVSSKSKAEPWVRIRITPDLELGIRGTPSQEQLRRFEQIADHLREILLGGMRDD